MHIYFWVDLNFVAVCVHIFTDRPYVQVKSCKYHAGTPSVHINLNNALVRKTYYFAKLLVKIVAIEKMIAKL